MEEPILLSSKYFPPAGLMEVQRLIRGVCSDFEFWNFTYTMPTDFVGTPNLGFDVELK
jgi:hypothetical protein